MQGFEKRSEVLRGTVCTAAQAVLGVWHSLQDRSRPLRETVSMRRFPRTVFKGIPVRPAAKPGMAGTYRMMISFPVIFDKHDTLVLFNLTLQLTVLRKFHILHLVSSGTYVEF